MTKLGKRIMALAIIPFLLGMHKLLAYNNGELFREKAVNAYVGGDAYNYIINGNYFTGFMVMALIFVVMGGCLLIAGTIKDIEHERRMNEFESK